MSTCSNCKFFNDGYCKRHAPTMQDMPSGYSGGGRIPQSVFVNVSEHDLCGDHELKNIEPNDGRELFVCGICSHEKRAISNDTFIHCNVVECTGLMRRPSAGPHGVFQVIQTEDGSSGYAGPFTPEAVAAFKAAIDKADKIDEAGRPFDYEYGDVYRNAVGRYIIFEAHVYYPGSKTWAKRNSVLRCKCQEYLGHIDISLLDPENDKEEL